MQTKGRHMRTLQCRLVMLDICEMLKSSGLSADSSYATVVHCVDRPMCD